MITNTGSISLPANSALAPFLRVKLSGGKLVVAGATDKEIGILEQRALAANEVVPVVPIFAAGVVQMVAAGPITQYATVYGAASGKIDDTSNENLIGIALDAATADGDYVRVIRQADLDNPIGDIEGRVIVDDDFISDYPAAATAFGAGNKWLKVETNGLGVTESGDVNGALKFAFDAVVEAATAALYMPSLPFDVDSGPIMDIRLAIYDIGDDAALDINFGLANGTHATDFDSVTGYVAFHLDGNSLVCKAQSADGVTTVAATTTGVTLVDDTYATFRIDATDVEDVKLYINGTRVCSGSTFKLDNLSGGLTPIVHVEKTSNDTTADVRVDRVRVQCDRA